MICTVPIDTPVTTPVEEPTVANAVLLLLHVPPGVATVNVVVCPTHTLLAPLTDVGGATIVTVRAAMQLVESVYVIVAVPVVMPFTTPDEEPMVATDGLPLLQVPPEVASLSMVVMPVQAYANPDIGEGSGLTVMVRTAGVPQPLE